MNPHTYESLRRPDPYENRPVMRAIRACVLVGYLYPAMWLIARVMDR